MKLGHKVYRNKIVSFLLSRSWCNWVGVLHDQRFVANARYFVPIFGLMIIRTPALGCNTRYHCLKTATMILFHVSSSACRVNFQPVQILGGCRMSTSKTTVQTSKWAKSGIFGFLLSDFSRCFVI